VAPSLRCAPRARAIAPIDAPDPAWPLAANKHPRR
jgi:hypothetical protein